MRTPRTVKAAAANFKNRQEFVFIDWAFIVETSSWSWVEIKVRESRPFAERSRRQQLRPSSL
jgi:hypothetical protein